VEIKTITDRKQWNDWVSAQKHVSFTQSFEWGEILKSEGKRVERLFVYGNGTVVAAAQIVETKAYPVSYFFCPKGPVIKEKQAEVLLSISEYIKNEKASFLRYEPVNLVELENNKRTIDVNPRATVILEVVKAPADLLSSMHSKTRYNIRLAQKKELSISTEKNWESFWSLMKETGKRDGFRLHHKMHYEKIFVSPLSRQFTVMLSGKPIATMVTIGFGDTCTYLYGASDYEHRSLMAPYVLQWEAILAAKAAGYRYYDFFGIAPKLPNSAEYVYDEKHQYAGVTRFKLGFGGVTVEQPGTFDLIISPFTYRMYGLLRRLRRLV
jgi:lipid II:glycine glycyltransferase (peptidoglycan interpeptide bridge formation enzyme)